MTCRLPPMNFRRCLLFAFVSWLGSGILTAGGARLRVQIASELSEDRAGTVIVLPFREVRARLPEVTFDHVQVRHAGTGALVPFQITNFTPNLRPAQYDDLIWQHDFVADEPTVTYFVEITDEPVPPFPSRVMARPVPERLDDFAWENDRMAHRAYGARLNTGEAGSSQLRSSGLDFWAKRVRYLVVDRWYLKGHDAYHVDTGEGLDMYSVGSNAGVGGTVVWRDGQTYSAGNWQRARVLANGPIRAVFELDYAPIVLPDGATVRETKRFVVDAGRNLDRIESTFAISGPAAVQVGFGLTTRAELSPVVHESAETGVLCNWSTYPEDQGALGTGVLLDAAVIEGFGGDAFNRYALTTVRDGSTIIAWAGGGWSLSGDFPSREVWEAYLKHFARRLASPVTLTLDPL